MASLNQITQQKQITPVTKTSFFSWKHIMIAIMIAVLLFVVITILNPSTGGGTSDNPGPPTPVPAKSCTSASDCDPDTGSICDIAGKCSGSFIPYDTDPTDVSKIPDASWRGGDDYTLKLIKEQNPFFLRAMNDDGKWGYFYKSGGSLLNTSIQDTNILPEYYVFKFVACDPTTPGGGKHNGFLQPVSDFNMAVQCGMGSCDIEKLNLPADHENLCKADDDSWQMFRFLDIPSTFTPPSGMGGTNGISSPALIIKKGNDDRDVLMEIWGGATKTDWESSHSPNQLFQVAFVNASSQVSSHSNLFDEILTGIFK